MTLSRWQRFRQFSKRKVHDYPRDLPPRAVVKSAGLLMLGPAMLLICLVFYGYLEWMVAMWSAVFLFCISLLFIFPYLTNLTALTHYVRALAKNEKAEAPDLRFLNVIEDLQKAVGELNQSWQSRGSQLEATFQESQILINSLPDAVIVIGDNLEVIGGNLTAKNFFKRTNYKATAHELVHSEAFAMQINDVIRSQKSVLVPHYMAEPYRTHFSARIVPFPSNSVSRIRALLILHDVTYQKKTEQMLSDFVANASHEIRTPLTSVIGYIELLQTTAKDDAEALDQFLPIMQQQTERIRTLVRDLLSLSNIERMVNEPPTTKVSLVKQVEAAVEQMHEASQQKSMPIHVELEQKKFSRITADETQIAQICENLLTNAIKYGQANTAINVVVKNAQINGEKYVCLEVTNRGNPIPETEIPRLTERFYRIDKARSRTIGGNGLGLAIVQQIVERHRGQMTISSSAKDGTCFSICFPV